MAGRTGRVCKYCGKWFECVLYSTRAYCNHRCRQGGYEQRRAAKAAQRALEALAKKHLQKEAS